MTPENNNSKNIRDSLKSNPGQNQWGTAVMPLSVYIQEVREDANTVALSKEDMEWAAKARRFKIIFMNALIFVICFALIGLLVVGAYLLFSDQFFWPISKFATAFMDARVEISSKYGAPALFFGDIIFAFVMFVVGAMLLRFTLFRKEIITYNE